MPNSLLRVLVVANKTFEVDPLVGVLVGKRPKSKRYSLSCEPWHPLSFPVIGTKYPRLQLSIDTPPPSAGNPAGKPQMDIELWCIEDCMSPNVSSSSSREKWQGALPYIKSQAFSKGEPGTSPHLVIAFGTSGMPSSARVNGCVTVGSRVMLHDPFWNDPSARRSAADAGDAMLDLDNVYANVTQGWAAFSTSVLRAPDVFRGLPDDLRLAAEGCFLAAPLNPASPPRIFAGSGFAALSTINITNYDDFIWADPLTMKRFTEWEKQHEIGSMETTHGLIRAAWADAAFLYCSGVTDCIPRFDQEVPPRNYAQNFVAAHNAAVTLTYLLPYLLDQFAIGKLLVRSQR